MQPGPLSKPCSTALARRVSPSQLSTGTRIEDLVPPHLRLHQQRNLVYY